ncbi:hypothetical protein RND71_007642 [Anisodus tanguticus]|uniref:DM2 domain-containing protein n=1 Tax=Anisodus tanguticus TaxID=243964 RepID=A0AAE1SMQ6_9SOLA|nr:hypothetical protein RND71_007642 [Anisodus tanguticus]
MQHNRRAEPSPNITRFNLERSVLKWFVGGKGKVVQVSSRSKGRLEKSRDVTENYINCLKKNVAEIVEEKDLFVGMSHKGAEWTLLGHGIDQLNPMNKREINCDRKLKTLLGGKDKVGFIEVSKLLSAHFVKPS